MTESLDAHPYTSATVYSAMPMPMKLKTLLMKVLHERKLLVNPTNDGDVWRDLSSLFNDKGGTSKDETEKGPTPKT